MTLRAYIGYDAREQQATRVAAKTLVATSHIEPELLDAAALHERGLLTRPVDRRSGIYDLTSNAPASTDFAISRFLVPIICQGDYALFTDCDVVFLRDVHDMLEYADPKYAVNVVQHDFTPVDTVKMDGQPQAAYYRKCWSSVILWNLNHPANKRLSLYDINNRRGLWLHQFGWLADSEIGALPGHWNWLVGVQPKPEKPSIAHYTLGTPDLPGYEHSEHAEIWLNAAK